MTAHIQTLENLNLGMLRDGSVVLKASSSDWEKAFQIESLRILSAINEEKFKLHHIGSTSIPGIQAKPILDILIEVRSIEEMDDEKSKFERLSYEYKGEYGIPGRRYCVLYNADKSMGYVHVHAFATNNVELAKHLIFRDYLRAHPNRAADYSNLKAELLESSNITRSQYGEAKQSLINEILSEAKSWKAKI